MARKANATYPVSIDLGVFVLGISISTNSHLFNRGKYRQMGKLRKTMCENVEK